MRTRLFHLIFVAVLSMLFVLPASATIWKSVPDETVKALGLTREASPKALYDALASRYLAELTKGKFADWWEPIPMDQYLAPTLLYQPPTSEMDVTRDHSSSGNT